MIQVECDNVKCRFSIEGICQKVFLKLKTHTYSKSYRKLICKSMEKKVT